MNHYNRAIIMVLLAGAFLSTLGIATRLLDSASGLQVVFYRSVSLLPTMLMVIAIRQRGQSLKSFMNIGKVGLLSSACLVGTSLFIVLAVTNTSVANAMFIISLAPLVAGVFARLLLGEKMSNTTIVAIVVALAGVLFIIQGALSADGLLGIVFAFCMLTCYGLFSVTLRMGKGIDMLPCVALHAAILIIALGLFLPELKISVNDTLICLALGVFQLGAGLTLFTLGSKHVPAAQLTLLAMLEVVLSPIWVWVGVGETPSTNTLIGGGIIILAISYQALAARPLEQTTKA